MITKHLDYNSLTDYIYGSLDGSMRENIEAHLLTCPKCRKQLAGQQLYQRNISNELHAVLSQAKPSSEMTFAAISARLQTRRGPWGIWRRIEISVPAALALTGLALSVLGLWQFISMKDLAASSRSFSVFPTLSCFFFLMASVESFGKSFTIRPRFALVVFVTALLWLGTALLGLLNIIVVRDLAILAVVALDGKNAEAGPIAILAVMGAAMLYIGLVVGGAEYHYRNIGHPNSWKLISITLLIQLFILILPYLLI